MQTSQERDEQLLAVGQQCSHASCLLIDFLPFKCQHCDQPYCQEHFLAKDHQCPSYDESKHNRIAPRCPLCNEPVAIPPGQDPNVRMDIHLTKECTVMTGRRKQKSVPVCEKLRCTKTLYQPIRCDKCRKQFCASHRFPDEHDCVPIRAAAPSRLVNLSKPSINAQSIGAKVSSTSQAIKKHVPTSLPKPSTAAAATTSDSSKNPSKPILFSKTDSPSSPSSDSIILLTMPSPPSPSAANDPTNKPEPAIRRNAYAPPPIFGNA